MAGVGILAYGSLINDPGPEIEPLIERRIQTTTPFPVEYGRLSRTRGGSATVVPYSSGCPVKAEVLVLPESVSLDEAKNLLWRRETRREESKQKYKEIASPNAVVIRDKTEFCGLRHVFYTDFDPCGKISSPDPGVLARAAVDSVMAAPRGKDGISYLMQLVEAGVVTALTPSYQKQILDLTATASLVEALESVRARKHGN